MPIIVMIIAFSFTFALGGAFLISATSEYEDNPTRKRQMFYGKLLILISFLFFFPLAWFWLTPWSVNNYSYHDIETVTYKNGEQEQVAFVGDKKINITVDFRKIVPEGSRLQVTHWNMWKGFMWNSSGRDTTYAIHGPKEVE